MSSGPSTNEFTKKEVPDSSELARKPSGEHERQERTLADETIQIVDWDGPDDPNNPKNWSSKRKWAATSIASLFTLLSPTTSSIISPATSHVVEEFGITNTTLAGMITSIFVLGFAVGPLLFGPLSEIYGRSRVVQWATMWFLIWNLVCGFAQTTTQLIIFRFFAGLGGSASITIGAAVIGDTFNPDQRGRATAIYALGPMVGPALGPVVGAWIATRTTWRWVFWSTSIFNVLIQIAGLVYLQETYAPVLLERKAKRLAKAMSSLDPEKASKRPIPRFQTPYESEDRSWQKILGKALTRPFILFAREPIIQLLGAYMSLMYGVFYLFITTMPGIFQNVYHESTGIGGLNFIALGSGMCFASFVNSRTMDKIYRYYKDRNGGVGEPEFRVPTMVPASIAFPLGILMSGWGAQHHVHWIVVDVGIFLVGTGIILAFQCIQTYIIDVFTLYAASGVASVFFLRALFGFCFPLFADEMYNSLGYGKGNTILSAAAIALGCPAPWILWFYV
ncbi:hypothetical protein D9758_002844 [Tetrapyrgos nigripes]|uniref:Major facilitator superfamily (MFS) profile domain-containing protein n=1 Tax=Tetrapyrgos nigripes TaxID=182062 RepID=A0A8H5LTI1_9AGAR|nr:hypothetical protein D9758_002844 [Tetrapyrgos nigripes]